MHLPDRPGQAEGSLAGSAPALEQVAPSTTGAQHADGRPPRDETVVPARKERPPFRLGNRPPLTGIRALALFTVLTYHSNFHTLPGAWASIQVFFVLSGFLITAMLSMEAKRHERISLKQFYARRAARLLPPLVLTVALLGIYAAFVHVADASQRVWGDSLATLFYYADYRQAFLHAPFFGYLAQSWTLSIEEQFYVLWSILMVVAVAVGRRRLAYLFAIGGALLSVGDRLYQVYGVAHFHTPDNAAFVRIYYAFDTRADGLFIGCLLGLLAADGYFERWRPWAVRLLTAAAAASAAFMVWIYLYAPLFTENLAVWWLPLTTVASATIIVFFVIRPDAIGSRLVGIGVFVFIGDLSYTVYLVHFPVYLAIGPAGTGWGYWPTQVVRLAVIFAIAIASWFLIEKPLMAWRRRSAARAIGPTTAEP